MFLILGFFLHTCIAVATNSKTRLRRSSRIHHSPSTTAFQVTIFLHYFLARLFYKQLGLKTNLRISATVFNLPRITGAADGVFGLLALLCKVRLLPRAQGLAQNDGDWPLRCVALALARVAWTFNRFTVAPRRTSQIKRMNKKMFGILSSKKIWSWKF